MVRQIRDSFQLEWRHYLVTCVKFPRHTFFSLLLVDNIRPKIESIRNYKDLQKCKYDYIRNVLSIWFLLSFLCCICSQSFSKYCKTMYDTNWEVFLIIFHYNMKLQRISRTLNLSIILIVQKWPVTVNYSLSPCDHYSSSHSSTAQYRFKKLVFKQ